MLANILGLAFVAFASVVDVVSAAPPAISIPLWDQYVDFLKYVLDDLLAQPLNSGGWAIILFTIGIKTLMLPFTIKATRSSKAMQELQPKIGELRKKYGKDRQELSMRTMELYRQYNINPMAGCLPILIQIPIFFGVYSAINSLSNSATGPWAQSFLWLPDLGEYDPYRILPFVAAGFQFVQTRMMRPANQGKITDPQQAMMNTMMNFMPLMVIVFGWTFASGAVLYWAIQSVYSVVQQWLITGWGSMKDWFPRLPEMPEHRRLGYRKPMDLDSVVVVSGERPRPKGFGGWMARKMEESQKLAEERRAAQKAARGETGPAGGAKADRRGGRTGYQAKVDTTVEAGADVGAGEPASATDRPRKRASGRSNWHQANRSSRSSATDGAAAGNGTSRGKTDGVSARANGAGPLPTPRKTRPSRKPTDKAGQ